VAGFRKKLGDIIEKQKEKRRLHLCDGCGVNTSKIKEYYMVHDEIWLSVSEDVYGMLCIGCLEERLGRRLTPDDFMDCPVNNWKFTPPPRKWRHLSHCSDRLLSRLTGD